MPTLWEILTKKKEVEKPLESLYYNPLELRIGNIVKIDTVDFENLNFSLNSLREVKRKVDGNNHTFVDYAFLAKPYDGDTVNRRLRIVPVENGDKGFNFDIILFNKISECGYDKPFHDGLNGQQEFKEGEDTYWRVNDLLEEWVADVAILSDEDQSGKVDVDEIKYSKLKYWDFWRETEDDGGSKILEFYIVEMDESGYFQFWLGHKIDASRVIVS